MALSKQRDSLFDPFRKAWVVATPEEKVRQRLLQLMTAQLGYPKHLLAIEKELSLIPHLKGITDLPKRRADILCFAKEIHPDFPLYPLLLIECKEGEVGNEAKGQVLGYNHFVQAFYVAIAGENCLEMVYPQALSFLPSYSQLLDHLCN